MEVWWKDPKKEHAMTLVDASNDGAALHAEECKVVYCLGGSEVVDKKNAHVAAVAMRQIENCLDTARNFVAMRGVTYGVTRRESRNNIILFNKDPENFFSPGAMDFARQELAPRLGIAVDNTGKIIGDPLLIQQVIQNLTNVLFDAHSRGSAFGIETVNALKHIMKDAEYNPKDIGEAAAAITLISHANLAIIPKTGPTVITVTAINDLVAAHYITPPRVHLGEGNVLAQRGHERHLALWTKLPSTVQRRGQGNVIKEEHDPKNHKFWMYRAAAGVERVGNSVITKIGVLETAFRNALYHWAYNDGHIMSPAEMLNAPAKSRPSQHQTKLDYALNHLKGRAL